MTVPKHPDVTLAILTGDADYLDVIELGRQIAAMDGYFAEGGARNVARRDGMGTVLLAAVETLGVLPDHYVQAVGSGTGGIAVWEMSKRLAADGRFGPSTMKLHFVQNAPFDIMTRAWGSRSRDLLPLDVEEAKRRIAAVRAQVLTNRHPPYSISGGVFDSLTDTAGYMYSVSNDEAREAGVLFEESEGCDLHPAAEVALAGLRKAVEMGRIKRQERVLLNVTGGGIRRIRETGRAAAIEPDIVFHPADLGAEALRAGLRSRVITT